MGGNGGEWGGNGGRCGDRTTMLREMDIRMLTFKASEAFEVGAKEAVANWVN